MSSSVCYVTAAKFVFLCVNCKGLSHAVDAAVCLIADLWQMLICSSSGTRQPMACHAQGPQRMASH
jgi:hypothetical protein